MSTDTPKTPTMTARAAYDRAFAILKSADVSLDDTGPPLSLCIEALMDHAQVAAAQAPRPVPEGDRTSTYGDGTTWPWWVHIVGDPEADRGLMLALSDDAMDAAHGKDWAGEPGADDDGFSHAECHAAALRLHAAITAPFAARIEALEAENARLREEAPSIVGVVCHACEMQRGDDHAAARDQWIRTLASEMSSDVHEETYQDAEEAFDAAARIAVAHYRSKAPRPTVDSGGLDESVPPPRWHFSPEMYDDEDEPFVERVAECCELSAAHDIYRRESAPAVAAATATLVAERDAALVKWVQCAAHISGEDDFDTAHNMLGLDVALRLFPAGPRAEREQADGE